MAKRVKFDREKFKRLVHYVIWRAGDRDGFGATKLNKVLWFAEARLFVLRGRPIAGAKYIREKYGPVPQAFVPIRDELAQEGAIRVWKDSYHNRTITRMKALTRPDVAIFDREELKVVDFWISHIDKDHTASSVSEQTHDYAWEIAKMGEELPLYAPLVSRIRDLEGDEKDRARKRAKELRLL